MLLMDFFFSSRRRHTRFDCDWSSDVCSSDLYVLNIQATGTCQYGPRYLLPAMPFASLGLIGFSFVNRKPIDRKSTRLNSSHSQISYAVFCLKKKKKKKK